MSAFTNDLRAFKAKHPGVNVEMPNCIDACFADRETVAGKEPSELLAVIYRDTFRDRFKPSAPLEHIVDECHVAWLAYEEAGDEGEIVAKCCLLAIAKVCDGIVEQNQLRPDALDEYESTAKWIRAELARA